MFAVIYRSFIYPDREKEYKKMWKIIADYFVKHRGAIGSTLHQTENEGEYIAYSRWPDLKTRDASWGDNAKNDLAHNVQDAIRRLKDCIDRTKPHDEICMDVVEDFINPGKASVD